MTEMGKIIITAKAHEVLVAQFRKKGYEVLYLPEITYEELLSLADDAEGLVVTTRIKIDKAIIDKVKNFVFMILNFKVFCNYLFLF